MIISNPVGASRPSAPEVMPTRRIFAPNNPVYLRFTDNLHNEKMVLVTCMGLQGNSTLLSLEWSTASHQPYTPPSPGSRVQCYTISNGVLYRVMGRVEGIIQGEPLRLDLAAEDTCNGLNLRRHARFDAAGTLRLACVEHEGELCEFHPLSLDISLGGFGAVVQDRGWQAGEELLFELEFIPLQRPGSQLEFSMLGIAGSAVVRKRTAHSQTGLMRLGCEFIQLPEVEQRLLKLLLSAHGAALRSSG